MQAVAEYRNIQSDIIPRISTGFCSGMARTGGMCGCVTGSIMAISLVMGRNSSTVEVDPCYQAVREFLQRFRDQFGSMICLELTGVHLGTPEGQAEFRAKGQFEKCINYVGEATRLVVDIIDHL